MTEDILKKLLTELEMIRKIKMIELMERGYSQSKLGNARGISQASVSRMMSSKKNGKDKTTSKVADNE